jgi:hypothetical protein
MHWCRADAQRTVQELEKLYITASTAARTMDLAAAAASCNAVPPTAQVVDAIQDMWCACWLLVWLWTQDTCNSMAKKAQLT